MTGGFKTVFKGFDKQEVLDYIERLSDTYASGLAEKDRQIEDLLRKNRELKRKLREAGNKQGVGGFHDNQ